MTMHLVLSEFTYTPPGICHNGLSKSTEESGVIAAECAEIRDLYPLNTSQNWLPLSSTRWVDAMFAPFFSWGAVDIAGSIKEHSFKLCIRHIMSLCSTLNSSVLDCRLNSFFFLSVRWGKSSISTLKLSLCRQTKLLFGNSLEERRRDLQSLFLVSFLSLLLFVPTSLSIP